jgi:cellulose synthase (UDP-forming)
MVQTTLRIGSWFQAHERLAQSLGVLAIVAGAGYLSWRVTATREGADPILFWVFLGAEVFGFIAFIIMVCEAWRLAPTPRLPVLQAQVDIVIATYNEDADVVEPTLVGALAIRGNTMIHLCDDGRRPEMKDLAERYGVRYVTRIGNAHAKAGNINAVLPSLDGDLLLVLDADHVASPDILDAMSGYFARERTALVQSAHSFRNHNSIMHSEEGRHEQSLFFDVLLPGRNRLSSVFWCGSAALIRTSALRQVGGIATQTPTEDFETSLLLQAAGYDLTYHNEHLIQGVAPDNMAAYVVQRARWAEGSLAAFHWKLRLPFNRRLSKGQHLSYLGALLHYLMPVQRTIYAVVLVLVGVWGIVPVSVSSVTALTAWGLWMIASAVAITALHRGSSGVLDGLRYEKMSFEAHLRGAPRLLSQRPMAFAVTPKNDVDLGGWQAVALLRVPLFIAAVLALTLLARGADAIVVATTGTGFLAPLELPALVVIGIFALIEIVTTLVVARSVYRRRQLRALWRFPVSLAGTFATEPAACVCLHQGGAAFLVRAHQNALGDQVAISVVCDRTDGSTFEAQGTLTVSSQISVSESGMLQRISGPISWRDADSRTAVIDQCYVVEPYRARHRAWARSAPRVPVALAAELAGSTSVCSDVSLGGASFVTEDSGWLIDDTVPMTVRTAAGQSAAGNLRIRSVSAHPAGGFRVAGVASWNDTSWLADYGAFVLTPRPSRRALIGASAR